MIMGRSINKQPTVVNEIPTTGSSLVVDTPYADTTTRSLNLNVPLCGLSGQIRSDFVQVESMQMFLGGSFDLKHVVKLVKLGLAGNIVGLHCVYVIPLRACSYPFYEAREFMLVW
jgi:hypothetical protein